MNLEHKFFGYVVTGRGRANQDLSPLVKSIEEQSGLAVVGGSLNLVLHSPLMLRPNFALRFDGGHRMFWRATAFEREPVLIYRWSGARPFVCEVLATNILRESYSLIDGSPVPLAIDADFLQLQRPAGQLLSRVIWSNREEWFYAKPWFPKMLHRLGVGHLEKIAGATQLADSTGFDG